MSIICLGEQLGKALPVTLQLYRICIKKSRIIPLNLAGFVTICLLETATIMVPCWYCYAIYHVLNQDSFF